MAETLNDRINKIASVAYSFRETVVNTYELASECLNIPGVFVECGVGAGSQIAAMQLACEEAGIIKKIFAFDSYEGIPLAGPEDETQPGIGVPVHDVNKPIEERLITSGITSHSVENVKSNIESFGLSIKNIQFIKGWFQNTLPGNNINQIALLRLDGDLYESTIICLEYLYPKVVDGGIVITDDYALPGCRKAVKEYFNKHNFPSCLNSVPPEGNGVVWFRK